MLFDQAMPYRALASILGENTIIINNESGICPSIPEAVFHRVNADKTIRPLGAKDGSLVRVYSKPCLTNRNPSRQLDSTARFELREIARKHARINFTFAFKEASVYPKDNG
jgi:hypothetical protein